MANTIVFNNQKTENEKDSLCFEDLEIGDVFMHNFPEAWYHFIKVKKAFRQMIVTLMESV